MYFHDRQATDGNNFMPRCGAADDLDRAAWALQHVRKEANERFVCREIYGRRGNPDFQFVSDGFTDLVFRSTRLNLQTKENHVSMCFEIGGRCHEGI